MGILHLKKRPGWLAMAAGARDVVGEYLSMEMNMERQGPRDPSRYLGSLICIIGVSRRLRLGMQALDGEYKWA